MNRPGNTPNSPSPHPTSISLKTRFQERKTMFITPTKYLFFVLFCKLNCFAFLLFIVSISFVEANLP